VGRDSRASERPIAIFSRKKKAVGRSWRASGSFSPLRVRAPAARLNLRYRSSRVFGLPQSVAKNTSKMCLIEIERAA
jgi:hypothetical protein